jgi:hypothetical protein
MNYSLSTCKKKDGGKEFLLSHVTGNRGANGP